MLGSSASRFDFGIIMYRQEEVLPLRKVKEDPKEWVSSVVLGQHSKKGNLSFLGGNSLSVFVAVLLGLTVCMT